MIIGGSNAYERDRFCGKVKRGMSGTDSVYKFNKVMDIGIVENEMVQEVWGRSP